MDERAVMKELRENPELLKKIMQSPDGKKLLGMLNHDNNGFQRAVQSAAKGDTTEMANRIRQITQSADGAALITRIQAAIKSKNQTV